MSTLLPRPFPTLAALPLCLILPFAATAEDQVVVRERNTDSSYDRMFTDLRLVAAVLDDDFDYDASGNAAGINFSDSGSDRFDDAWRAGVVAQGMHFTGENGVGLSSGLGLFYSRWNGNDDNTKVESLTVQLRIGLGVNIGDVVHLEVLPFAGVGGARGELGDVDSGDVDLAWEYGGEVGLYATFDSIQLGVQGGWMRNEIDLNFDDNSQFGGAAVDNVSLDIRNEGIYVGASVGTRF